VTLSASTFPAKTNPLPSWSESPTREAILDFIRAVTDEGGEDFVPPSERIATFDNDGTLWVEYPIYTQFLFTIERLKALAPQHPEWQIMQPFKAVLEDDREKVGASGVKGLMDLTAVASAGMTADKFAREVRSWLTTTRHPRFDRVYARCIYLPQLELLDTLRAHAFKTFIVSGGDQAFMCPVTAEIYGIPPEQVIGSTVVSELKLKDGQADLVRKPGINSIVDRETKPVSILQHIGQRPILAFGNSDADREMIEYTMAGKGRRLGLFLHHTDAVREYAYDREGQVGVLARVLDDAAANDWVIVDMKNDWSQVFPDT